MLSNPIGVFGNMGVNLLGGFNGNFLNSMFSGNPSDMMASTL